MVALVPGLRFDRMELAGSLADLGTMLPLLIPLVVINGLNATVVLLMVGLFYIGTGLYYKIPIPVQPLKAVAIIAITAGLSAQVIAASGLLMGVLMLFLGVTKLIVQIARVFSRPVIRGVQVALGLLLFIKAAQFILGSKTFISGETISLMGVPLNAIIGLCGLLVGAFLLTNSKIPAAIVLVVFGLIVGAMFKSPIFTFGPQVSSVQIPGLVEMQTALFLLVIPQIPVTLTNAVISTSDLSKKYFKSAGKASHRALASSIGLANVAAGMLGGMPMCHGAGGLAAHYRFGARTGGANLLIGGIFVAMALLFGSSAVAILGLIPLSILGVMLAFTGIQMMMLAFDIRNQRDFLVVSTIAGLSVAIDMTIAFVAGVVLYYLLKWCGPWLER
jgi:SulP family sulfate permease